MAKAPEIELKPGWLKQDMNRASNRVCQWEHENKTTTHTYTQSELEAQLADARREVAREISDWLIESGPRVADHHAARHLAASIRKQYGVE